MANGEAYEESRAKAFKRGRVRGQPRGSDATLAVALEADGFQFLIDRHELWKPPRGVVRRRQQYAEVWLDEDDVSFLKSRFPEHQEAEVLAVVRKHLDDLLSAWCTAKDDVRRDRFRPPRWDMVDR